MFLSFAKRAVRVLSIVVFVVCGFAGAAVAMAAYTAIFSPGGEETNVIVVLGFLAVGLLAGLATSIAGVVLLGKLFPGYRHAIEEKEDRDA